MTAAAAPVQIDTNALLRRQFQQAHPRIRLLVETAQQPAAVQVARIVLTEDLAVSTFLLARRPLAFSTWRGRTGLSELPRFVAPIDWQAWAARVELDRVRLRWYARAVHHATDAALEVPLCQWSVCMLNALLRTLAGAALE